MTRDLEDVQADLDGAQEALEEARAAVRASAREGGAPYDPETLDPHYQRCQDLRAELREAELVAIGADGEFFDRVAYARTSAPGPLEKLPPEERIARMESLRRIERDCAGCHEFYVALIRDGRMPFAPSHRASPGCRSGGRNHCTCDTCF